MHGYCYRLWGVSVQSSFPIPELSVIHERPDVFIQYGTIPDSIEEVKGKGVLYQASYNRFLLQIPKVGKFLVTDGNKIIIQKVARASQEEINLFLFDTVFAALFHQREILPLQGSCIEREGTGLLLLGLTASGKSTLAGAFWKRGYRIVTDNICAVSPNYVEGTPHIFPGFPQLSIWEKAAETLKVDVSKLKSVRPGLRKYALPIRDEMVCKPLPLFRIYILFPSNDSEFRIKLKTGVLKIRLLRNVTCQWPFLEGLGKEKSHFKLCNVITNHIPIYVVHRPRKGVSPDRLVTLMEEKWQD